MPTPRQDPGSGRSPTARRRFAQSTALILAAFLAIEAAAQRPRAAQAEAATGGDAGGEPFTESKPERMRRLGYVGFGPFRLGGYHGTADVDALIGPGRMRWLETAHFKIGSGLPAYAIRSDSRQRKKIQAELARLAARLPGVDPETRALDPWLRLHLLAQRCEEVYADLRDRLGYADEDFPRFGRSTGRGASWMGIGPHLGQGDKFIVLVMPSAVDFGHYSTQYLGRTFRWPHRFDLGWKRGLLFGTAPDFEGGLQDDTVLHCHIVYSVVHNLLDGFRGHTHETPVWFKTGLAQWYLRRIDDRYPNFDRFDKAAPKGRLGVDWQRAERGLIANRSGRPLRELATFRDYGSFTFLDYVTCWAVVDFLVRSGGKRGIADFWFGMKTPFGDSAGTPDWSLVLDRQREALHAAFELADFDALEAAWRGGDPGTLEDCSPPSSRRSGAKVSR